MLRYRYLDIRICVIGIARVWDPARLRLAPCAVQLLREVPRERAEWIAWMDMDIILDDMRFELPLAKYAGKDFVIWGQQEKLLDGDAISGERLGFRV